VAHKLLAFVLCACFTGFAGALMAMHIGFVNTEGFPFLLSIEALAIIIVGGIGSVLGAVLGTVFIVLLPEAFSLAVWRTGHRRVRLPEHQRQRDQEHALRRGHHRLPDVRPARPARHLA
jgi:ABC-type branched-subunit amino acid transport system permease subunit